MARNGSEDKWGNNQPSDIQLFSEKLFVWPETELLAESLLHLLFSFSHGQCPASLYLVKGSSKVVRSKTVIRSEGGSQVPQFRERVVRSRTENYGRKKQRQVMVY